MYLLLLDEEIGSGFKGREVHGSGYSFRVSVFGCQLNPWLRTSQIDWGEKFIKKIALPWIVGAVCSPELVDGSTAIFSV
jgi:hypothetical protein